MKKQVGGIIVFIYFLYQWAWCRVWEPRCEPRGQFVSYRREGGKYMDNLAGGVRVCGLGWDGVGAGCLLATITAMILNY